MARKRINLNAVCSSENYKSSKKLHNDYVRDWHNQHTEEIEIITRSIVIKRRYFVSVFGELVEVTETEARMLEKSVKIIVK